MKALLSKLTVRTGGYLWLASAVGWSVIWINTRVTDAALVAVLCAIMSKAYFWSADIEEAVDAINPKED